MPLRKKNRSSLKKKSKRRVRLEKNSSKKKFYGMFGDGCGLSLNVTDDNYVNKFNMPKEKLPCFDDKGFEKEIEGRIRAELLYNTKFGVPRVPCTSIETCPNVLELNKLIAKTPKNKNSIISELLNFYYNYYFKFWPSEKPHAI